MSDVTARRPRRRGPGGWVRSAVLALSVSTTLACASVDSSPPDRGEARTASLAAGPGEPTDRVVGRERDRTVLAISIDGLRPGAVRRLGADGAPTLHRLLRQGAGTLNARTAPEDTRTLPNHTSMITGRSVAAGRAGHGVDVNCDPGGTVHDLAGHHVSSLFEAADRAGGRPALFASKDKFALFQRSWRRSIDRFTYRSDNSALTGAVLHDLATRERNVRFVHYSGPDSAGHDFGFASAEYLDAVRRVDGELAQLVRRVACHASLRSRLTLILTADHGGSGRDHHDLTNPDDFTVPFLTWGAGVARGADLYDLNSERRRPGRSQVGDRGRQPIRNGDLANVALAALGLPALPGSTLNARQGLDLSLESPIAAGSRSRNDGG